MLSGQGVVAIWNGIAEEGRQEFYEWHIREHMPERVGIPGFSRGRRYRTLDKNTHPEFFTLYEVDTFEVMQGQDYANRLNAPTPWTKSATSHFKDTSRGLARVLSSNGYGPGGTIATIRFRINGTDSDARVRLADAAAAISRLPLVTGAHVCRADDDASGVRTVENKDRSDIQAPPNWFVLLEGCTEEALAEPVRIISDLDVVQSPDVGLYIHEYTRLKTDWSAG